MQYAHRPRAARAALPRLRHARQRAGPARARQQRADARAPRAAPGRGARCSATRNFAEVSLVPKMADSPAAGDRLPARPRAPRAPLRRARPGRAARVRRRRARPGRPAGLGLALREREAEGSSATPSATRRSSSTSPSRRCWTACSASSRRCSRCRIRPDSAPVWNPTRALLSHRARRGARRLVGQFYLDPYARTGKRPGAWMDDVRGRWARPDGPLQTPVAHLVCNFAPPRRDGKPALLTHDDVITLFHEFGHGLHHMLTQVDDIGVAGISGVEWDAVELPSQFMENFCWEWDVLKRLTAHVDTGAAAAARAVRQDARGEELPERPADAAPDRVRAVRHARCTPSPAAKRASSRSLDEVRDEVAVVMPPRVQPLRSTPSRTSSRAATRPATTATSGPRCCRADAWSAFEEGRRASTRETGRRYRAEHPRSRRQPRGDGKLQGLPRPRATNRCAAAPPGHGLSRRFAALQSRSRGCR